MRSSDDDLILPADLTWCPGVGRGDRGRCGGPAPHLGHYYSPTADEDQDSGDPR